MRDAEGGVWDMKFSMKKSEAGNVARYVAGIGPWMRCWGCQPGDEISFQAACMDPLQVCGRCNHANMLDALISCMQLDRKCVCTVADAGSAHELLGFQAPACSTGRSVANTLASHACSQTGSAMAEQLLICLC